MPLLPPVHWPFLRRWRPGAVGLALVLAASSLRAWGPHGVITRAALDAVTARHGDFHRLGSQALQLTNHCWIADYKRLPYKDGEAFIYADDYLLFPGMTRHPSHLCPEVRATYRPFFRRALQAWRMESPENAARWTGSLLHFLEDTGSPPHAAEISGGIHVKMENWVDASLILLPDYTPRILGDTDESAEDGFVQRMDGLIAFSRERGLKLSTPVLIGNRRAVEPVVLESALETARVTADLLATMKFLCRDATAPPQTGVLEGEVRCHPLAEVRQIPARLMLAGTNLSILTDLDGKFIWRGLPAGEQVLRAVRPSCGLATMGIHIEPGQTNRVTIELNDPTKNLIRNGNFVLRWLDERQPDFWYQTDFGWEGEIIPLEEGRRYRLEAQFRPGVAAEVVLRWSRRVPWEVAITSPLPKIESRPLKPDQPSVEFEGTDSMGLIQVTIKAAPGLLPQDVCERVVLAPLLGE